MKLLIFKYKILNHKLSNKISMRLNLDNSSLKRKLHGDSDIL